MPHLTLSLYFSCKSITLLLFHYIYITLSCLLVHGVIRRYETGMVIHKEGKSRCQCCVNHGALRVLFFRQDVRYRQLAPILSCYQSFHDSQHDVPRSYMVSVR